MSQFFNIIFWCSSCKCFVRTEWNSANCTSWTEANIRCVVKCSPPCLETTFKFYENRKLTPFCFRISNISRIWINIKWCKNSVLSVLFSCWSFVKGRPQPRNVKEVLMTKSSSSWFRRPYTKQCANFHCNSLRGFAIYERVDGFWLLYV